MLGEQKNIADAVIRYLRNQKEGRDTFIGEILIDIEKKSHTQDDIRYVLKMLKYKGFVESTGMKKDHVFLTDKGWLYDNYDKVLAEEEYQATLVEKERKSIIDTNKSVQDTNDAIRNNIPVQNRQTKFSILVGVFSAIFILVTVYQTCTDTTAKELKGIKEALQEIRKEQKSLKLNPEQKPVNIQINTKKDSTNKKHD